MHFYTKGRLRQATGETDSRPPDRNIREWDNFHQERDDGDSFCVAALVPGRRDHQRLELQLGHGNEKIVFSVRGDRSLADETSGGDFDGDEFVLIWNASLVDAFPSTALSPWSEEEQRRLMPPKAIVAGAPTDEVQRENAAAWHLARVRGGEAKKGWFANMVRLLPIHFCWSRAVCAPPPTCCP